MVPMFESADRFKSKEISPTPAIMNSQLQLAIVRKIYSRLISDFTDIRPRMLYNCRVSFIMKYCTVFKLEIILSTESEMVWPCESRAEGKRQIVTSRKCQT